jgi:hypothetical protein
MPLFNYRTATELELIDYVTDHLLKQGVRSFDANSGGCRYRDDNGNKCAAGCLISDDEYNPSMEGSVWINIVRGHWGVLSDTHADLIAKLQDIHDFADPSYWAGDLAKLRAIAATSHLAPPSADRWGWPWARPNVAACGQPGAQAGQPGAAPEATQQKTQNVPI